MSTLCAVSEALPVLGGFFQGPVLTGERAAEEVNMGRARVAYRDEGRRGEPGPRKKFQPLPLLGGQPVLGVPGRPGGSKGWQPTAPELPGKGLCDCQWVTQLVTDTGTLMSISWQVTSPLVHCPLGDLSAGAVS